MRRASKIGPHLLNDNQSVANATDQHEGRHAHEHGENNDGQYERLPSFIAADVHSTRSFVQLLRFPEAATKPSAAKGELRLARQKIGNPVSRTQRRKKD